MQTRKRRYTHTHSLSRAQRRSLIHWLRHSDSAHLLVHLGQQLQQLQLAVVRQGGEVVLVDEGAQVGVDQDRVGRFHVDLTPAALQLT